jgi:hypothetical protein
MLHSEFTPHAFITLSNFGGIEIMLNRSCDGVYFRYNYGQDNLETEEILEAEILTSDEKDRDGESYFIHNNGKQEKDSYNVYYLSEATRIE